MELSNNCGACAAAVGIDGKQDVVGCNKDMRLHNIEEEKECFYKRQGTGIIALPTGAYHNPVDGSASCPVASPAGQRKKKRRW